VSSCFYHFLSTLFFQLSNQSKLLVTLLQYEKAYIASHFTQNARQSHTVAKPRQLAHHSALLPSPLYSSHTKPSVVAWTHTEHFIFREYVLVLPSSWKVFPPETTLLSLTSFNSLLRLNFSMNSTPIILFIYLTLCYVPPIPPRFKILLVYYVLSLFQNALIVTLLNIIYNVLTYYLHVLIT
jgi:hypothetical protein